MTDGQRDGLGMRKCRKVNAAEQMSWKCTREERVNVENTNSGVQKSETISENASNILCYKLYY